MLVLLSLPIYLHWCQSYSLKRYTAPFSKQSIKRPNAHVIYNHQLQLFSYTVKIIATKPILPTLRPISTYHGGERICSWYCVYALLLSQLLNKAVYLISILILLCNYIWINTYINSGTFLLLLYIFFNATNNLKY